MVKGFNWWEVGIGQKEAFCTWQAKNKKAKQFRHSQICAICFVRDISEVDRKPLNECSLLRTRPDGVVIYPGFLFRLCPGCPGFDSGFILKINQNVHLFVFSTISKLFNVYWYQQKVLEAARWEDKAIITLSECIWIIPRLFRHYYGMPWL